MDLDRWRRSNWCGGQLMAFSGIDGHTDFTNGLTARTAFESPGIEVKIPGICKLRFPGQTANNVLLAGDFFELQTQKGNMQGAFLDAHHLLIKGHCQVLEHDDKIAYLSRDDRVLIGSSAHFDADRINADLQAAFADRSYWLKHQNMPRLLSPTAYCTLGKALSVMKTQVYLPEGQIHHRWTTPDRWPHRGMWLWDSVFHAIGWRHIDVSLAQDTISAIFDTQRADGFVAHMITPQTISSITQPPILGLGVKLVHELEPDKRWIKNIYPKLCSYVEWGFAHRDSDGAGLAEWNIEGDTHCRSGESGMDNSPRFDMATRLDAVDFNAFLALECEILSELAKDLDLENDVRKWKEKHRRLCRLINERFWSNKEKFYVDYDIDRQAPSSVLASSGFLPLICGAASAEQAKQLARHLQDPKMFGTSIPVPSVAAKDTEHYSKDMWRGPMWVNINWLIAYGFERYDMLDVANELRHKTRREIEKFHEKYGTLFEFYDDRGEVDPPELSRKGKCTPEVGQSGEVHQVIHDYGWTATLYADMIFERTDNKY